jgi:hypothetical protein
VGSTSDFPGQGDHLGGCGLPGFVDPRLPQVKAVRINIVAVSPAGAGDLRGWGVMGQLPAGVPLNVGPHEKGGGVS